ESQLQGAHTSAIVIGVGINVGAQSFSPELAPSSTCLSELSATPDALGREALLVIVLGEVERRVTACLEGADLAALLAEFRAHDALRDQRIQVSGAREISGIARGVDGEGRLLLETDGILLPIHSGTVRLLEV
ncbi:MAG TPA: hypothetical protein VJU61_28565, partial [Polyangiaceae bacterium]|nr:hypothetical protein [Polyangiaceae bacterium]